MENLICMRDGKLSRVQYLGLHSMVNGYTLRNSSISRNRLKICHVVRKYKKGAKAINTRKVFKAQSRRKITPFDALPKKVLFITLNELLKFNNRKKL